MSVSREFRRRLHNAEQRIAQLEEEKKQLQIDLTRTVVFLNVHFGKEGFWAKGVVNGDEKVYLMTELAIRHLAYEYNDARKMLGIDPLGDVPKEEGFTATVKNNWGPDWDKDYKPYPWKEPTSTQPTNAHKMTGTFEFEVTAEEIKRVMMSGRESARRFWRRRKRTAGCLPTFFGNSGDYSSDTPPDFKPFIKDPRDK